MNGIIRNIVSLLSIALGTGFAAAQSDAQFTQYWAVPNYYCPASIGDTDNIHLSLGSRLQWVGIDNAPKSFNALADMPFKVGTQRLAVGVNISQQSMGLYRSINAAAQLAYKRKVGKGMLSIGVQAGYINETFRGSEVFIPDDDNYHQSADDAIPTQDVSGGSIDFGAGVAYKHPKFWLALSATHLNEASISLKTENSTDDLYEFKAGRTYYFMGGGNIALKNTLLEILPSVLVKTDTKYFTGEATARVRYNKFLSGGVGYRWKDAVTVMIGAELKGVFLGYSFDYPVSNIAKGTSGSHELWLGYNVKLDLKEVNKNKHRSIRLM
ncbi:MAG: type IX secretion system membrane protein PorP/SprF [Muribaculaceae bacterium]